MRKGSCCLLSFIKILSHYYFATIIIFHQHWLLTDKNKCNKTLFTRISGILSCSPSILILRAYILLGNICMSFYYTLISESMSQNFRKKRWIVMNENNQEEVQNDTI